MAADCDEEEVEWSAWAAHNEEKWLTFFAGALGAAFCRQGAGVSEGG